MEIVEEKHQLLSESGKDEASPAKRFEIGETVKIKEIGHQSELEMEPEDYFYLKGFANKRGVIREQQRSKSGTFTFRVEFNEKQFGYFYGKDLESA